MKVNLSKRERFLLFVLLIFVILLGGLYGIIIPTINHMLDLKEQLSTVQLQQQNMQLVIDTMPSLQAETKTLTAQRDTLRKPFYGPLKNHEIDWLLTGLLAEYNLSGTLLDMTDSVSTPVYPFTGQRQSTDLASEEAASVLKITANTIKVEASGKYADFIGFVNRVNTASTMRVTSFTMTDNSPQAAKFAATIVLYMHP